MRWEDVEGHRLKITITNFDIAAGKRGSASCCPLALALARETNLTWFIDYRRATAWDGDKFLELELSDELEKRLRWFDKGHGMQSVTINFHKLRPPAQHGNWRKSDPKDEKEIGDVVIIDNEDSSNPRNYGRTNRSWGSVREVTRVPGVGEGRDYFGNHT